MTGNSYHIITTQQPASQTEGEWSCPISGGAYLYTIKIDLRKVVSGGPEDHISITHYGGQRVGLLLEGDDVGDLLLGLTDGLTVVGSAVGLAVVGNLLGLAVGIAVGVFVGD